MGQVGNQISMAWFVKEEALGSCMQEEWSLPPQPSQVCEREGGGKQGSCSESQGFSKPFATWTP